MKHVLWLASAFALSLTACKKNDDPAYNKNIKAGLSAEFDNIAGSSDLQLNTGVYTNSSNEQLTITKLKYYVSNFVLTNVDGSVYTVPQDSCYFLVDESDESTHQPLLQVPEGEYKTVTFLIGVDSIRSTSDISRRTGALDPANNNVEMYWSADQGYIFFNMEGTSPASSQGDHSFSYHVGGYSSLRRNNLKSVTLDLTQRGTPKVKAGKETNIHLFVDVLRVFDGTTKVRIAEHPSVAFDDFSSVIAGNYATMIRHDHTEN